jgi:MFS family permease
MVLGIMAGSVISGQTIAKTGRYKYFPLVGIVFLVVGLVLMSLIVGAETGFWTLVPFMVLVGLGLGFNFQPVVVAVQNAVSPREMGVATSSVTFFRQMGGTIGAAGFLSLLFTRLPQDIGSAVQDAVRANPELGPQFQQLGAGAGGNLDDTSFIQQLPEALAMPFKVGFSDSRDLVFLVAAIVVAISFFIMVFLPELPLRNTSGIQAMQAGEGELQAGEGELQAGPGNASADDAEQSTVGALGNAAPTSTPPPAGKPQDPSA